MTMGARAESVWRILTATVDGLEKTILMALLLFLLGFALLQIVLRNFFAMGIVWGDTLLRHVLLWSSLLGMARAVGERKYIAIELFPLLLSGRWKKASELACDFFSCLVAGVLCVVSWNFVQSERLVGAMAFLDVPVWWLVTVFPFAFAVMALRFACHFMNSLLAGSRNEPSNEPSGIEFP